jgi:hypothetical protein
MRMIKLRLPEPLIEEIKEEARIFTNGNVSEAIRRALSLDMHALLLMHEIRAPQIMTFREFYRTNTRLVREPELKVKPRSTL